MTQTRGVGLSRPWGRGRLGGTLRGEGFANVVTQINANGRDRSRFGPKMRAYVMARDNFRCRRCGASSCDEGVRLVIDHIVPVAKGGGNEHTNLQILCGDCNAGKSADAPHSHDLRAP